MADEEKEDYAVRAAREWQKLNEVYAPKTPQLNQADVEALAAIIRKHAGERIETEKLYTALAS